MSVQRLNRSQNWAVCLLGLVLLMTFAGLQAQAHPRKEAEIEITFNANTNKTEIVHRYRVADAEQALQKAKGAGLSIMTDPEAQALFGDYVEARISLTHNGKTVPLTLVGGEIADGWLWIYQEAEPLPEEGLYVFRHSALMDRYGEQVSIINVRRYDQVQSFILSRTAPWATFRLDGKDTYAD